MKNAGVIMAVAATAVVVLAVGIFSFLPAADSAAGAAPPTAPTIGVAAASTDTGAVQAAFAAREALIQSQVEALDRELAGRQAEYEAQAAELSALIGAGEAQLARLQEQETAARGQLDALRVAQSERAALYNGRRAQAQTQYQAGIQQLTAQLDEARAKLAEATAQLGQ